MLIPFNMLFYRVTDGLTVEPCYEDALIAFVIRELKAKGTCYIKLQLFDNESEYNDAVYDASLESDDEYDGFDEIGRRISYIRELFFKKFSVVEFFEHNDYITVYVKKYTFPLQYILWLKENTSQLHERKVHQIIKQFISLF